MNRRDFLEKTLSAMVLVYLQGCSTSAKSPPSLRTSPAYILNGHGLDAPVKTNEQYYINTPKNETGLMIVSLEDRSYHFLTAPCKGHEIVLNPTDRSIIFSASKWGQEAYLADFEKKKLLKTFKTHRPSLLFFGHAVFSSNGKTLYCSMHDHQTNTGLISVRDAYTLNEIEQIPTEGIEPHQIKWKLQDKVLSVLNDRTSPMRSPKNNSSLSLIDVEKKVLIDSLSFKQDRYAHFSIIGDMGIACRSSGKEHPEKLMSSFDFTQKVTTPLGLDFSPANEALSHALIPSKGLAIVTVINNKLVVWDYSTNRPIHIFELEASPRGVVVTADEKSTYITYLHNDRSFIKEYNTQDLLNGELKELSTMRAGSGSHLTMVYK